MSTLSIVFEIRIMTLKAQYVEKSMQKSQDGQLFPVDFGGVDRAHYNS